MLHFLKHVHRKYMIARLYSKYVSNNAIIKQDVEQTIRVRGCSVSPDTIVKKFNHLMLYYPEFAHIFFWRINARHHSWKPFFVRDFNCKIFGSTKIDGGLICYHPFAAVINAKSIGKNFQFRNSLTIGNKNNNNEQIPIIGDDVIVGANVVIIGDITVGNNVIIGAGSVVVKDIPSNSVVAGNPAKVIRNLEND